MSLQTAWCSALVVTLGAAKWFITSMDSLMGFQMTWPWAFVITIRAAKFFLWFFSSMYRSMSLKVFLVWKGFATFFANKWLLIYMCHFMPLQMAWNCKFLFTLRTGIRLIAQMYHLMFLETVQMPKSLGALGATVWHFLCVYSLMPTQTCLEFEALATHFAYERCLTCVNFFMRL